MITRKKKHFNRIVSDLLTKASISEPPVKIENIANLLNLKIKVSRYQGQGEISGVLIREANKSIIGVNSTHNEHRQRFTIAHEIAHYLLHDGHAMFVDKTYKVKVNFRDEKSKLGTSHVEIEANTFASMLLIPDEFLTRDLMNYNFDLSEDSKEVETLATKLADKYNVSPASMFFRLINR